MSDENTTVIQPSKLIKLPPLPSERYRGGILCHFAFGFLVPADYELCHAKLACTTRQELHGLTPKEQKSAVKNSVDIFNEWMPDYICERLPHIPRTKLRILTVKTSKGLCEPAFVIAISSVRRTWNVKFTEQHLADLRKEFGLPDDKQPEWYRILM